MIIITRHNRKLFGKVIFLGANDSADNWREITDEEASRLTSEEVEDSDGDI